MIRCKTCLMPDTRPRVVFTDGICNACDYHFNLKPKIDWESRKFEFNQIVIRAELGAQKNHNSYDCVVPMSGGKDSATIAYKLKYEHGLNPLCVCYGQMLWTDVGQYNMDRIAQHVDILYWRVNQSVSRKLAKRFMLERGHPKQHYDAGVNAVPIIAAKNFGIPLVFYAEHGETEYGGLVLDEESRRTRNLTEVLENQVGDHAANWTQEGISERDLAPYIYPDPGEVKAYYYSYFFLWDIYDNAKFTRDALGFGQASSPIYEYDINKVLNRIPSYRRPDGLRGWWGKSDGSFEGFDSIDDMIDDLDFYMMHVKFGFGRATRMASRLIQAGHMTREQGLELVKRYDGEFPETYLSQVLDYMDMTREELDAAIEIHRRE